MHAEDFVAISALTHLRPSSFITSISLQPIDTSSHSPTSVSMSITQWNLLKVTSDLFCTIAKRQTLFTQHLIWSLGPIWHALHHWLCFPALSFSLATFFTVSFMQEKKVYKMVPCTNRHWCLVNWWWWGTKNVVVYWVGGGVRRRFHE